MFMRSIGASGVVVVFVSVFAALTFLPALLAVLGPRVNLLRIRRTSGGPGLGFWSRSAEVVMRRPFVVIVLVAGILAALLFPVTHMKVGIPEATVLPQKYESRAGDDLLKENFEYAALNPMEIVADLGRDPLTAEGLADAKELGERVREAEGVARVRASTRWGRGRPATTPRGLPTPAPRRRGRPRDGWTGSSRSRSGSRPSSAPTRSSPAALRDRGTYGTVPPGTEEQVRAEVEPRVAEEVRAAEGEIRAAVERRVSDEVDRRVPGVARGDLR
jgi:RND superfamily putative drug exporter